MCRGNAKNEKFNLRNEAETMIDSMNVARQYESLQQELDTAILKIMRSGQYILGKPVEEFETAFAEYCGTKYAVGVGSGSDALLIALKACGIRPGDEVITTAMSYIATAEAIIAAGAVPVFVDCTRHTYLIDAKEIEKKITDKTKAVIPVHLYGQCADMDSVREIAERYNLKVIEDAAQAAGAEYKGKKAGSLGDAGCISFFPTKNLGAAGDGGIIVTNDEGIYRQCKALRVHGSGLDGLYAYCVNNQIQVLEDEADFHGNLPKYYTFVDGYNSRLDAVQAALLKVKLPYLNEWNQRRREIAREYNERIINPAVKKPKVAEFNIPVYYTYVIAVEKRNVLKTYLEENGIKSGVYFPVPFHQQRVFENLEYRMGDFPNAEFVAEHTLILPMFPELTQKEIDIVIHTINSWKPSE